jgi:hypothetical protein
MRTAALALGWQVWSRHRRGLTVLAAYGLVVTPLCHAVAASALNPILLVVLVIWPPTAALVYLLAIFSFGLEARVEAAESGFPARLWTLPLSTWELVGWPMLWGCAALAGGWLALALGMLRPLGCDLPLAWPALLLAAVLAWLQVVVWWPFGLPWARVFVAMPLLLGGAVIIPAALQESGLLTDPVAVPLLAVLLVLAYPAAVAGVARARHGAGRWQLGWAAASAVRRGARQRKPFASAGRAQVWFEWRQVGLSLPIVTICCGGIWLLCASSIARFIDTAAISGLFPNLTPLVAEVGSLPLALAPLLLLPVLFAGGTAGEMGRLRSRERLPLSSFVATRPVPSTALVAAKLWMAALSTLATWGLLAGALAVWLLLTGEGPALAAPGRLLGSCPVERRVAILFLLFAGPVLLTWLQLARGMWVGLTGRTWLLSLSQLGAGVWVLLLSFLHWLAIHPEYHAAARDVLPWLAAGLLVVKLLATSWVVYALHQRRLMRLFTLVAMLAGWVVLATALVCLLRWLVPDSAVPTSGLVLGVVFLLPLTHLLAAPLALEWNRHR